MSEDNSKKKIIILDDDKFLLSMYSTKFAAAGAFVETVESGEELLKKLKEGARPDLLLLDVIVPGMSGIETLQAIRKDNLAPQSKIVMLTNESDPENINTIQSIGVDGYIIKATATPSEVVETSLKVIS